MANKHMRRFNFTVIRETRRRPSGRHQLAPTRTSRIKKGPVLAKTGRTWRPHTLWVSCSHFGRQPGGPSNCPTTELPYDQQRYP